MTTDHSRSSGSNQSSEELTLKEAFIRISNPARGTDLATKVEVARTSAARQKGLLGRTGLPDGGGLWIVPCESVHTFFMKFPIDLVYIDRRKVVRKVRRNVRPWRISACLFAHSIIELPVGAIDRSQTNTGDRLEFVPVESTVQHHE